MLAPARVSVVTLTAEHSSDSWTPRAGEEGLGGDSSVPPQAIPRNPANKGLSKDFS
ncbi:hypothetical protein STIAU_0068 [Stigmatella aurantiaca DW4/3-1]|uniref:Uncharacterized protein n=1 Tax=Stigmatella aurantiaca (strain DW4/3-1) TaxID=378806 RepID=Q093N0_STIAD|nr:hypothetical protein STIAU_0068 [Stigmatella aurantiaca DW4/3-1]